MLETWRRTTAHRPWLLALLASLLIVTPLVGGFSMAMAVPVGVHESIDEGTTSGTDVPSDSGSPTQEPSDQTTDEPTDGPTEEPSESPSDGSSDDPSEEPSEVPSDDPGESGITDAVLRWGLSDEANSRAMNGGFNGFSAGRIRNPGKGSVDLKPAEWSQRSGNVSIEKYLGAGWKPATWAGLSTDAFGNALTSASNSNHQVVLRGGVGEVDPDAGTASISWTGDFTVFFYTGQSFFYVSDPVLEVRGGVGTLKATVSGFGSERESETDWQPLPPRVVTLADLPAVDLSGERGFTVTPAYLGVRVTGTEVPQVVAGKHSGSFPQSFITFLDEVGSAAFWYSSGASWDPKKVALPITVSYDGSSPITAPKPEMSTEKPPKTKNKVRNPPSLTETPAPGDPASTVTAPGPVPVGVPAAPLTAVPLMSVPSDDAFEGPHPTAPPELIAVSAETSADRMDPLWVLGGLLLLLAAGIFAMSGGVRSPRGRS